MGLSHRSQWSKDLKEARERTTHTSGRSLQARKGDPVAERVQYLKLKETVVAGAD